MAYTPGFTDVTAAISIAANDTSSGTCMSVGGATTYMFQLTGTWVATVRVQITRDGTNWVDVTNSNTIWNAATMGVIPNGNVTANGIYRLDISGTVGARLITTAYTSGTITGTAAISQTGIAGYSIVAGAVSVTGYPTAAAAADSFANPTITHIGADGFMFNGSTWDRAKNNYNNIIIINGPVTATTNGITQINTNARGAIATVVFGAPSGTIPTVNLKLEVSIDSGMTWLSWGAPTANLTAAGTALIAVYPTELGDYTTGTLAALSTGATVSRLISSPLPRFWRVVATAGGTTPSWPITVSSAMYIA